MCAATPIGRWYRSTLQALRARYESFSVLEREVTALGARGHLIMRNPETFANTIVQWHGYGASGFMDQRSRDQ